jgi:hypothetical protein
MLKSRPHSLLLLASGIVSASLACSSGGTDPVEMVKLNPTAGAGASAGGSDSGGTGAAVTTAGTSAMGGSTGGGQAGSQAAGGMGGASGGSGGAGGGTSGAGGGSGGVSGGSGGGGGSDAGKVVLFDGSPASFSGWYPRNGQKTDANPWTNNGDGTMTVKSGGGDILTKMPFTNVFLHAEYRTPKIDVSPADPQQRGNSGVYLKGSYEMQVLDTFGFAPANDYCGALYKIAAPLVSACKMAGEWNAYDIEFTANVCTNGTKTTNAKFVEVKLNDMLVQQNVVADHTTQAGLDETCDPRGVMLQDHGTVVPVSFRNIWAIPRN